MTTKSHLLKIDEQPKVVRPKGGLANQPELEERERTYGLRYVDAAEDIIIDVTRRDGHFDIEANVPVEYDESTGTLYFGGEQE